MADPLYYILLPVVLFMLLNIWDSVSYSDTGINNAIDALLCPAPEFTGLWNSSGIIMRVGDTYNYPNVNNQNITLTCTPVHTPDGLDYNYGEPAAPFFGAVIFAADALAEGFYKVGNFFFIVGLILTPPATFFAVQFLIPVFIGMYVMIGYGIYQLITGLLGGLKP